MSLRIFHVVFVIVSIMLCVFVTAWGIRLYVDEQSMSGLLIGLLFLLSGVALSFYGVRVSHKLKELP